MLSLLSWAAHAQERNVTFSNGRASGEIGVPLGQSLTINTGEVIEQMVVGNPDIADVAPLTDSSFNLAGLSVGRTNVTLLGSGGARIGVLTVEVGPDSGDLQRTLQQAIPAARVVVGTVNGRLHLSGTVPDAIALATVLDIASQYGPEPVINAIRVVGAQQVLLEVRFIEASRNSGRELGVSWFGQGSDFQVITGAGNTPSANLPSGNAPFGSVISRVLDGGVEADVLIQALERNGLARRLAEPNLVALSGEQGSFLAGGEVPIPIAEDDGQITVSYKEYGVRLNFTPTVLDNGLINLRLEPEVSQVDYSTSIQTGTVSIPAFSTRRVSTTVELRSGQSFAIAGLLQSSNVRTQNQVPILGQVPIVGALFRSASFQKQETDLVVIVTPRLAQAVDPDTPLRTPVDTSDPSSEVEFFLLGRQEVTPQTLRGFAEGRGIIGPFGHIIDLNP